MAGRRCLSSKITESDPFFALPASAQALYLHLNMQADDDGLKNWRKCMEISELIDALRVCADDDIICPACERYDKECDGTSDGPTALMQQAADALESQRFRIDALESERQAWLRDQETYRWIPVTERLPEPEKRVLLMTRYKGWNGKICREIMCGFYEDGNVWYEDSKAAWDYEMKREENYDESRDDYRVPEGWFEELLNHIDDYNCVMIGEPVTHWMSLPEPPEED